MINFAVKLAVTVAMQALQMGLQASSRTKGPRPDQLQVTTADYGTPLPRFIGARKFTCPIIWAKDLEVVSHTHKMKGAGKQTTYGTLGTFAIAIADCPQEIGPIDKVLKIWMDETLVYDVTGTGAVSSASVIGVDLASVMRIYTGATDQMPDPAYVAFCEAKYGSSDAPAFRECAHIVFDQLPCDNFGNRVPQITVLATSNAAAHYPYHTVTSALDWNSDFALAPGVDWMAYYNQGNIEWWDVSTRSKAGQSMPMEIFFGSLPNLSLGPDGTAYCVALVEAGVDAIPTFFSIAPNGDPVATTITDPAGLFYDCTRALTTNDGTSIYSANSSATGYLLGIASVSHAQSARDFCLTADGNVAILFHPAGSSADFTIEDGAGHSFTVTGLATRSGPATARFCHVESESHFFVVTDGHWYAIDDTTGAIKARGAWSDGTPPLVQQSAGNSSFWMITGSGVVQYSLTDASVLQTIPASSWSGASISSGHYAYDPVNDGMWTRQSSSTNAYPPTILYLNRSANAGVTLADVVTAQCTGCGMSDFDASLLTATVPGYSWTRSDGKSQLQPLLDIHDVDLRPHDFGLQFLPRGNAPAGSIVTQDFAVSGPDASRYTVTIAQDTDLPKTVRVNFADADHDQEPNNVISLLTASQADTQRDDTIDLSTYADSAAPAQQKADRYLRRQWNSRETIELALTAQEMAREPGDLTTAWLDDVGQNVRLDKQTFAADGSIKCTFTRDETALAALNANTTAAGLDFRDTETIYVPAPVKAFVIDAPYREDSDADVRPLLFAGAGAFASLSFPGVQMWEETGSGSNAAFDQLFATISTGSTWGTCNAALADLPSPWLWDRGNVLNVTLQNGSLTSCAEADVDSDPTLNQLLIGSPSTGWEYVNFCTATLQGDGSYDLSDFKRGRRGTEWMCPLHTAGEVFVLASSLATETMGTGDVGAAFAFKGQAIGRSLDSAAEIDLAPFTGATLKPYAPAALIWFFDGTDLQGTIRRRTRVGGAWTGGSTIPLSESSEAYEVDIYNGSTFKRTISISGTNTFTYTAAMAAADGIALSARPVAKAYQISDAVGRGFALAA